MQYGDEDATIVLMANKADFDISKKEVSDEEGAAFARKHNMPFFITSAKNNSSVSEVSELRRTGYRRCRGFHIGMRLSYDSIRALVHWCFDA